MLGRNLITTSSFMADLWAWQSRSLSFMCNSQNYNMGNFCCNMYSALPSYVLSLFIGSNVVIIIKVLSQLCWGWLHKLCFSILIYLEPNPQISYTSNIQMYIFLICLSLASSIFQNWSLSKLRHPLKQRQWNRLPPLIWSLHQWIGSNHLMKMIFQTNLWLREPI